MKTWGNLTQVEENEARRNKC